MRDRLPSWPARMAPMMFPPSPSSCSPRFWAVPSRRVLYAVQRQRARPPPLRCSRRRIVSNNASANRAIWHRPIPAAGKRASTYLRFPSLEVLDTTEPNLRRPLIAFLRIPESQRFQGFQRILRIPCAIDPRKEQKCKGKWSSIPMIPILPTLFDLKEKCKDV